LKNKGIFFATGCYFVWGIFPVYWKLLSNVSYLQIMAHRIIWASFFLVLFLIYKMGLKELFKTIQENKKNLVRTLIPSALIIAVNWTLYLYCIASGLVLESSLGYFINPLVNVLFGFLFFKERLNKIQWISVFFACSGVLIMILGFGRPPYIALLLATSFSWYGLIRKKASHHITPVLGTAVECVYLLPFAFCYLFVSQKTMPNLTVNFFEFNQNSALLAFAGVITALPLVWFSAAAKRLPYSALGFFQFIAPTLQFLCAIFIFNEQLSSTKLIGFVFIWVGALLFIFERAIFLKKKY
jgi:chloramphenicol-sensitive protein RarD